MPDDDSEASWRTDTRENTCGLTPVGDYLRRRYPPNDGATHYLGSDGHPGCCAGPHPACTYDSGWREAMRIIRQEVTSTWAHYEYVSKDAVLSLLDAYAEARH
jgi:hypothetical protein